VKWEAAPDCLRRLIGRTGDAAGVTRRRLDSGAALGPLIDVCAYLVMVPLAVPPVRGQVTSFLAAVALCYLPRLREPPDRRAGGSSVTLKLCLHVMVVTLLAFFLRSAVFALLTGAWGWPGPAAIVLAALATAAMIRPAYAYCRSYSTWELGGGAGWRAAALGVVAVSVGLRLLYAGRVELMPEEAYYWNYARHLDIGYLDHPPMVGWLISAGTAVFGDGEFGVRSGAFVCGAIAGIFSYRLTRNLFGEPSALVALVLTQTLPFFFLSGMLMTPDAPLTAAWAAALYFLERALIAGRSDAWWRAGLCFGIGLLSKYTIALLALSALLFLLFDSRSRRWLSCAEPYAAAALAMAIFSPVLVWNARNDWASFAFQTSRRLADRPQFALHKLIASALVLLTPTGVAGVASMLARKPQGADGRDAPPDQGRIWRFLQVTTLTPVAVFIAFSLHHEVKLDWTGAPWIAAVPALAFGVVRSAQGLGGALRAGIRRAWAPTLMVLLLLYGAGLYDLTLGVPGLGYGKHAELVPIGWRELGRQVNDIAEHIGKQYGETPLVVGMDRYAIASELAYYAPDRAKSVADTTSGHLFGQVGLMYERWFPIGAQRGRALLLVAWNRDDLAASGVVSSVERLEPIHEGVLKRGDEVIRRYYYRLAYGYRGLS
jgi:dolichol-phosphate mannosyltransferase